MRSRRSRAACAGRGSATRSCRSRSRASAALPPVAGDGDELAESGVELLVARALEPLPQDGDDLPLRSPVDEDDEAEAERLLVRPVQRGELSEHGGVVVGALLGGGTGGETGALADRRVRRQCLELLFIGQLSDRCLGPVEGLLTLAENLDQPRPALEELGQLVLAQLPR